MLLFDNGDSFSIGSAPYVYEPASKDETSPRIILFIKIGEINTRAFIDTGGVYLFCPTEIADQLNLDPSQGIPVPDLRWRGVRFSGSLYRLPLTLLANEGESLIIEATAFVPHTDTERSVDFPCILGMSGCLERLRFAVDPASDTFYFGEEV
jgi:hypothetical protein